MTNKLAFFTIIAVTVALAAAVAFASTVPSAGAQSFVSEADLEAGDLIRGESFTAVYYYAEDGFRYVFPNDKTYFTWYDNFDDVQWLEDSDMSDIQIGGNVTYKPGVKMIKITSDPRVYVVAAGGEIRAIPSEDVATDLYGSSWNTMIDDVPDGFFPNYTLGSELEFASQFDAESEEASAWSINYNKGIDAYTTVNLNEAEFDSVTIDVGTAVRFINTGADKHGASSDDGSWGTGTLNPDDHFSRYFDEEGEYVFHDKYDSGNEGTITVE
jgi:plastocyanin/FlaG/FlaF family flagellin (archaellin)